MGLKSCPFLTLFCAYCCFVVWFGFGCACVFLATVINIFYVRVTHWQQVSVLMYHATIYFNISIIFNSLNFYDTLILGAL